MRGLWFAVIIAILIILVIRAWNKETQERHVEMPKPRTPVKPKKKTRSSREDRCREILERLFEAKFPTKRPSFLKNPKTGRNLELDGYNEEIGLAFEYNGRQHYEFPNTFHRTEEDFKEQRRRDALKANRCRARGVSLITIPYNVPEEELEDYIVRKLNEHGFEHA